MVGQPMGIRDKVLLYAEAIEGAGTGPDTIFRSSQAKQDLETAAWKLEHRLSAASYHVIRVASLVDEVRARFAATEAQPSSEKGEGRLDYLEQALSKAGLRGMRLQSRSEVVLRDDRVPFEMEAFFSAGRSALDYFAQVVSRYVRGREFSSMSKLGPFAVGCANAHPLWSHLAHEWNDWIAAFIAYRDDLIHRVVSKTSAARSWSSNPKPSFLTSGQRLLVGTTEVLFLVPRVLDRAMSISRWDILGWHPALDADEMMPSPGVHRMSASGSISVNGVVQEEWGTSGYDVHEGYVPAQEFLQELEGKFVALVDTTLTILMDAGFVHVQHS